MLGKVYPPPLPPLPWASGREMCLPDPPPKVAVSPWIIQLKPSEMQHLSHFWPPRGGSVRPPPPPPPTPSHSQRRRGITSRHGLDFLAVRHGVAANRKATLTARSPVQTHAHVQVKACTLLMNNTFFQPPGSNCGSHCILICCSHQLQASHSASAGKIKGVEAIHSATAALTRL